ncbi:hypothetical protein TWF730_005532 [Orbilia blumenaviensis]|uniref:Uncharacterized protein n=1 Tax=Orbilia blumenaviensis TaxID=1796055 RepID=A0AAV9VLX1_9PEZI
MPPCNSTQTGTNHTRPTSLEAGTIQDRDLPAQDSPQGPTITNAPQPSGAPDNNTAPDLGEFLDNQRSPQPGPHPHDFSQIGAWVTDNSN